MRTHELLAASGRLRAAYGRSADTASAPSSLSVHPAARGSGDIGQPDGLARKIRIFEEAARDGAWVVRMPALMLPADVPTPAWVGTAA